MKEFEEDKNGKISCVHRLERININYPRQYRDQCNTYENT